MGKAATLVMLQQPAPAREPTTWMHAPSQPLMRSPLSRFQTPTAPRRNSRFFQVWLPFRSPWRADHSAYFGLARFISPILSAVDVRQAKQLLHPCQRNSRHENKISVKGMWKTPPESAYFPRCAAFHFAQRARCAAAILLRASADMVLRRPDA